MSTAPEFSAEPTEVKASGKQVLEFFNPEFIGNVKQELKDAYFAHFCLYVYHKDSGGTEKRESITIGHWNKRDFENDIMTISTERPETLKALLRSMDAFYRGRKK